MGLTPPINSCSSVLQMRVVGSNIMLVLALVCVQRMDVAACANYVEWEGDVSSDWNNANNWEGNSYPSTTGFQVCRIDPDNYVNAPVLSAASSFTVEYLIVQDGGVLTLNSGASLSCNDDIIVQDGATLTINGGALSTSGNSDHIYITDDGSSIVVNGGSLSTGGSSDLYIGEDHPNAGSGGSSGSPTLHIDGGTVNTNDLIFGPRDDDGTLDMDAGTLNVGDDITDDSQNMDIDMSGGTINISDDLNSIRAGNTLDASSGTINISGDWIQSGTTTITGGTVVFEGTTTQSITSSGTETFYNLTIDNSDATGINLNDPIEIHGTLTMTDGLINGSSINDVTLIDDASVSGASNASYVDGYVSKIGNDAFSFPVGDAGSYNPISISAPGSAAAQFTAVYFDADPDASYSTASRQSGLNNVSREEYWILDRDVSSSNVNVTLSWDVNSGPIGNLTDLLVARWDGSQWVSHGNGGTTGNTSAGTIVSSGTVNSFSPFALGSSSWSNPLPVEWLSFDANWSEEMTVSLDWVTATEHNCDYFTIQRSSDAESYHDVGAVDSKAKSNGRSNIELSYSWRDNNPAPGVSYYRIKQVDFDGSADYSTTIQVSKGDNQSEQLSVWNSSTNTIEFSMELDCESIIVNIIDINGHQVSSNLVDLSSQTSFRLPTELNEGVYFVRLSDPNSKHDIQFLKVVMF